MSDEVQLRQAVYLGCLDALSAENPRIKELEHKVKFLTEGQYHLNEIIELREAERDKWEAAFNSERKACLALQTERDRLLELLSIFKEACDPERLDHKKLESIWLED